MPRRKLNTLAEVDKEVDQEKVDTSEDVQVNDPPAIVQEPVEKVEVTDNVMSSVIQAGLLSMSKTGELFSPGPDAEKRLDRKLDKLVMIAQKLQLKINKS